MRMNQPVAVSLVVLGIIATAAMIYFARGRTSWGFKDVVKNPELWEEMSRGRRDGERIVEQSKQWSDAQVASEVEHFLFGIKSQRDDWAKGKALQQLSSKVQPHVLRFLRDSSFRGKLVKPTGKDLVPESPFNRAAKLLEDQPPSEAAAVMDLFLDEPSKYIRCDAALVLGVIGSDEAVLSLRKALGDSEEHVRSYALIGIQRAVKAGHLGAACRKELFPDLQHLLMKGENADAAADLLLEFDMVRGKEFILSDSIFKVDFKSLPEGLEVMASRKISVPRDRLLILVRDLEATEIKYPQSHALREALRLLGQHRRSEDVPFLEQRLTHSEKQVAQGAAFGLLAIAGLEDFSQNIWGREKAHGYPSLTQPQRHWIAVSILDGEINNGGLSQYFVNSSGDHWPDALAGLEAMGAMERAAILREAVEKFGRDKPAQDRARRQDQLAVIVRKDDALFDKLDSRYYASKEGIEVMATLYVLKNQAAFK